jgi:hypothetical protein
LNWHLNFGTRPDSALDSPGARWSNAEFAEKLKIGERSVRNWRAGREKPTWLGVVETVLFGKNKALAEWRLDLREAYDAPDRGADVAAPDNPFLGRDDDLAVLVPMLVPGAAVLVQGPPGIGKTELTRAAARAGETVARFGEGRRWFVALQTAATA